MNNEQFYMKVINFSGQKYENDHSKDTKNRISEHFDSSNAQTTRQ
jgi:hypothetical protein